MTHRTPEEIQRYTNPVVQTTGKIPFEVKEIDLVPDPNGKYVLFSDHAALSKSQGEELDLQNRVLENKFPGIIPYGLAKLRIAALEGALRPFVEKYHDCNKDVILYSDYLRAKALLPSEPAKEEGAK